MNETKPKKMVSRNVAIALGIICIVLVALIAYFTVTGISATNSYDNLQNQNRQLQDQIGQLRTWLNGNETLLNQTQTWLDENGTLLNQTQANIISLQNQVSSLNSQISQLASNITYYNSQISNLENQIRALEAPSYPLNSMWVSPCTIDYNTNNASVGTLFNITVWANMQNSTYAWQVTLDFNASIFQEVSCGYTAGSTSIYFRGHTIIPVAPVIDNFGGSVLFGESLLGNDYIPANNASLMYVEFNITTMPTTRMPFTGLFDINATSTTGTFFLDTNGNTINSAANLYDANYTLSLAVPPTISNVSQVPDVNSVNASEPITVLANVTDNSGTGILNVTILYSPDVWVTNYTVAMTLNITTGLYEGIIPAGTWTNILSYIVQAYDNSGGFTESLIVVSIPYV